MSLLKKISLVFRMLFINNLINEKNMQNFGLIFILEKWLKRIIKTKTNYIKKLLHYSTYFWTNPYFSSVIIGGILRLEEKHQSEKAIGFKNDCMSSIAALGDIFTWDTVKPLLTFITIGLFFSNYPWAPLFFIISFNLFTLFVRFFGISLGYKYALNIIQRLKNYHIYYFVGLLKKTLFLFSIAFLINFILQDYNLKKFDFDMDIIALVVAIILISFDKKIRVIYTYSIFCLMGLLYYFLFL